MNLLPARIIRSQKIPWSRRLTSKNSKRLNCRKSIWSYIFVFAVTILAYAPLCRRYVLIADDCELVGRLDNGILFYFKNVLQGDLGIWRCFGVLLMALGAKHELLFGPLALLAHASVACLFLLVCRTFYSGTWLPIILAICWSAFPATAGAVVWASAANMIVMQGLFFIAMLIMNHWGRVSRCQIPIFILVFTIAVVAILVQENLLFAFAALPTLLWIPRGGFYLSTLKQNIISRYSGLAPILAVVFFIVGWKLFPGTHPNKTPHLHLASAISPYFRQYAIIFTFEPWKNAATRAFIFKDWSLPSAIVAIVALLFSAWSLFLTAKHKRTSSENRSPDLNVVLLVSMIIISLGASAIYAAAGGFSLDSRKQYPLLAQSLLILGWLVRRIQASGFQLRHAGVVMTIFLAAIGVPSTWMYINIFHYSSKLTSTLADVASVRQVLRPARIDWGLDIYQAWPHASVVWGFRCDDAWVLDLALKRRGWQTLRLDSASTVILCYSSDSESWKVEDFKPRNR